MLIQTKNLSKSYGNSTVVDRLNLQVAKGQLIAYIGTNGAGKSTTIRMLTGLLEPSSGQVILADGLKIGMVFQNSVLDDELTVLSNLKSRAELYKHPDMVWFDNLLDMMGLSEAILHQEYGTLSGGQKRRVDIARALLNKPDLLFLDEPTTGLDIQTRQSIWSLLRRLQKEEELTIFLTTHYLEEAENADMAYILEKGCLLAQGSADDLKKKYAYNSLKISPKNLSAFHDLAYDIDSSGCLIFNHIEVDEVLTILTEHQAEIDDFDFKKGDINDAFLNIAGTDFSEEV